LESHTHTDLDADTVATITTTTIYCGFCYEYGNYNITTWTASRPFFGNLVFFMTGGVFGDWRLSETIYPGSVHEGHCVCICGDVFGAFWSGMRFILLLLRTHVTTATTVITYHHQLLSTLPKTTTSTTTNTMSFPQRQNPSRTIPSHPGSFRLLLIHTAWAFFFLLLGYVRPNGNGLGTVFVRVWLFFIDGNADDLYVWTWNYPWNRGGAGYNMGWVMCV